MSFNFNVSAQGIVLANSHRGYSYKYPENTMPAFIGALEAGTRTMELDIAMTKDEKLVVIHDFFIDRVSNGTGYVADMTLEELRQYDFGVNHGDKFKNTPIPELREVLTWAVANDVGLIVEAKQRKNHQRFAEILVEELKLTKSVENIQLLAFDHVMINRVKDLYPEVQLQVVALERYCKPVEAVLNSNASSVCVEYHYLHRDDLVAYKEAGLTTRLYLHEYKNNQPTFTTYNRKYGYETESEVIGWLRDGLIDMLSHDDIEYLKMLIEKAGKKVG